MKSLLYKTNALKQEKNWGPLTKMIPLGPVVELDHSVDVLLAALFLLNSRIGACRCGLGLAVFGANKLAKPILPKHVSCKVKGIPHEGKSLPPVLFRYCTVLLSFFSPPPLPS